jgi:hypothetical protein
MAVERSYTIVSVAWNSNTWDADTGGPVGLNFGHPGRAVLDRTGDDVYSPAVIIPERDLLASFRLRQISLLDVPGAAKSNLVFRIKVAGRPDTEYSLTFHDMVLTDTEASLQRSVPGEMTLTFAHEHVSSTVTKGA